jgi:hypothetical protein
MEPLPYLGELLSLKCVVARRKMAEKIISRQYRIDPEYTYMGFINKKDGFGISSVSCVFGSFHMKWEWYKTYRYYDIKPKNGIEILDAKPNATGNTYSLKCLITVKELKEACKENGIKPVGDKKRLLRALMDI